VIISYTWPFILCSLPEVSRISCWSRLHRLQARLFCHCTLDTDVVLTNSGMQKVSSCTLAAILNITPLGIQNYCVRTWHLAGDSDQNFERFPFHPYTGHGFSVSSFCKINFWKCIFLFE
jgi:hypothetical protein